MSDTDLDDIRRDIVYIKETVDSIMNVLKIISQLLVAMIAIMFILKTI